MTLNRPGSFASRPGKTEHKIDGLVRATRRGERNRVRTLLAALPVEKARILQVVVRRLEQLAVANDSCLVDFASALCLRVQNTTASDDVAKAFTTAAQSLVDKQHWSAAAALLRLSLELHPAQPQVGRQLARVLANLGERSAAVTVLLPLLVSNPANVSVATLIARLVDANEMAVIGHELAPIVTAHAEATPALTARCAQVLMRLMCPSEAAALLSRLDSLEDPESARTAFDIAINILDAPLASRALRSRRWQSHEHSERDAWLAQLALMQADRHGLAAAYERLSTAGALDLLGRSRRKAGNALGHYADAISGVWNWSRRRHIAESVPQLVQPGETLENLAGKRVLIIAFTELGDEIYPLELLDRVRTRFASCTIIVDRRIEGLVGRGRDDLVVVGKEKRAPPPDHSPVPQILRRHLGPDVWAKIDRFDKILLIQDLMALVLRTEEDLPKRLRTLEASSELRAKWRKILERYCDRPRLGLFWRSGRITYKRTAKSTNLRDWAPLLKDVQGSVVSLQYGSDISTEIMDFRATFPLVEFPDLDTRDDLESVAALMCELDLIVTIPGTTMYLAGALGVPTLAVCHPSQLLQRTRLDGKTSIWSPTVEVVSGPGEMGFAGAILAASRCLPRYLSL